VAMNTPPVSNSVRSREFAGDSIGSAEVSLCPFTLVAKGTVPRPGIEVIVGTQPPLKDALSTAEDEVAVVANRVVATVVAMALR